MQASEIILSTTGNNSHEESVDKATCGICRRQVSRYTCPSCNVPYCSLTCFRSNEHSQCSEIFYKQQLESEIRTQPSASMEERKRMLEMLKKFEDEGVDDDLLGDEEDDKDDLAERLGGIDIGRSSQFRDEKRGLIGLWLSLIASASASDIWNALTPEERETFLNKIRDPGSSSVQEFLQNAGIELEIALPWWEASETSLDDSDAPIVKNKRYGKRPALEDIPQSLLKRRVGPDTGLPLLYNICAVFIAYAYITRHLGMSPLSQANEDEDRTSARQLARELVPFLSDKRSTILFNSMDDLITDMWPRIVDGKRADRRSFVLFLRDAARLLTPRRIALVDASSSSAGLGLKGAPQLDALLALSDLIALFKSRGNGEAKETPASLKIRFYAAHIATLPPQLLAAFSAEVGARARSIEAESESDAQGGGPSVKRIINEDDRITRRPAVEEL